MPRRRDHRRAFCTRAHHHFRAFLCPRGRGDIKGSAPSVRWHIWRDIIESRDRKSTRLNSSHTVISYAVFCLKKKTKTNKRNAEDTARRTTRIRYTKTYTS